MPGVRLLPSIPIVTRINQATAFNRAVAHSLVETFQPRVGEAEVGFAERPRRIDVKIARDAAEAGSVTLSRDSGLDESVRIAETLARPIERGYPGRL